MERNLNEVTLALDSLRLEKDSLVLDLFEQTKYKDEVEILRKEKERLSEKADALWKEVKDHQDLGTDKEIIRKLRLGDVNDDTLTTKYFSILVIKRV
mgnify:CR=1 FL=1